MKHVIAIVFSVCTLSQLAIHTSECFINFPVPYLKKKIQERGRETSNETLNVDEIRRMGEKTQREKQRQADRLTGTRISSNKQQRDIE